MQDRPWAGIGLLLVAAALLVYSVLSTDWFSVQVPQGRVEVGLREFRACATEPIKMCVKVDFNALPIAEEAGFNGYRSAGSAAYWFGWLAALALLGLALAHLTGVGGDLVQQSWPAFALWMAVTAFGAWVQVEVRGNDAPNFSQGWAPYCNEAGGMLGFVGAYLAAKWRREQGGGARRPAIQPWIEPASEPVVAAPVAAARQRVEDWRTREAIPLEPEAPKAAPTVAAAPAPVAAAAAAPPAEAALPEICARCGEKPRMIEGRKRPWCDLCQAFI